MKLNGVKTTNELLTGKNPVIKHRTIIGCVSFVLNKTPKRSKWDARTHVLVGYSEESKAYRLWKAGTRQIVISKDVRFMETKMYNSTKEDDSPIFCEFLPQEVTQQQIEKTDKYSSEKETDDTNEEEMNIEGFENDSQKVTPT